MSDSPSTTLASLTVEPTTLRSAALYRKNHPTSIKWKIRKVRIGNHFLFHFQYPLSVPLRDCGFFLLEY